MKKPIAEIRTKLQEFGITFDILLPDPRMQLNLKIALICLAGDRLVLFAYTKY
jgi:hypothetical protein